LGYILAKKVLQGVNIQQSGSGHIGATNVLRVVKERNPLLGKVLGAITLFLDVMKGMVIILFAKNFGC